MVGARAQPDTPRDRPPAPTARRAARGLAIATLAYLAFVVYGSLVPLDWTPRPFDEAWRAFQSMPFLRLGAGDRADWVANILLMIPFGFLLTGVLDRLGAARGIAFALAFLAALGLALAIEFGQIFFPPRTVSVNDIVAEAIGAALGAGLWVWRGDRLLRAISGWARSTHIEGRSAFLLYGYVLALAIYNLLPFDLTLSLTELYGKWRSHRVVFVPFSFPYGDAIDRALDMALDLAAWIPVGALARMARMGSAARVLAYCAGLAMGLEFLQLFVLSRVSDVTDVILAILGAGIGIVAARHLGLGPRGEPPAEARSKRGGSIAPWAWAVGYSMLILAALWFPFDFRFDPAFVRDRYAALWSVPFEKLYFQSEFRAIATLTVKAALFVPLGLLIAMGLSRTPAEQRRPAAWLATTWVVALAALGEFGQVFLPGKYADVTDVLIGAGGAFVAALVVSGPQGLRNALAPRGRARGVAVAYTALLALVWGITHWPGAPYNVRELLRPGLEWLSASLLAAAIVWLCAFPALAAWAVRGRDSSAAIKRWPGLMLAHGAIAYVLLALAVPEESIGDLVGSPVLGLNRELEYFVRSTVLYSTVVWLVFIGTLTAWPSHGDYRGTKAQLLAAAAIISAVYLPLAHWVIVVQAATDNLVELMHDGGGVLASLALGAFLVVLGATGAWIARLIPRGGRVAWLGVPILMAASALVGYGLVWLGTEQALFKYGKVFSAAQFLLSTDREHYLGGNALLLRFAIAYALACAVVGMSWRLGSERPPAASGGFES
jgi:glycopeptide antibiotics resistance protein